MFPKLSISDESDDVELPKGPVLRSTMSSNEEEPELPEFTTINLKVGVDCCRPCQEFQGPFWLEEKLLTKCASAASRFVVWNWAGRAVEGQRP